MLTDAQKQTLKTFIAANPVWAAMPKNSDTAFFIAAELNKTVSPDFIVWSTDVTSNEIGNAWSGTDIDGMSALNMQRLQLLLASAGGGLFDMSRADRRAGFENPFGTNVNNTSRVAMRTIWKRKASVVEKLFATGTGTDASPATMSYESPISYQEVESAF